MQIYKTNDIRGIKLVNVTARDFFSVIYISLKEHDYDYYKSKVIIHTLSRLLGRGKGKSNYLGVSLFKWVINYRC